MIILIKNANEKTLPMLNAGEGGMWPHHPNACVIIGVLVLLCILILILVVPVPVSTL